MGVYARKALAFPGSGGEHPILPGEVKVVATSAIDHTPVHPDLFDLSSADFEIRGPLADKVCRSNDVSSGLKAVERS